MWLKNHVEDNVSGMDNWHCGEGFSSGGITEVSRFKSPGMLWIPLGVYRGYYNTSVKFKTQSHTFSPITDTIKSS